MHFDVIILGLGAMGSAAAWRLAERGKRVLGIEQFTSPHNQGSSHGGSRIIRQAYFESPDYIPLVLRAYELWHRLERDCGSRLVHTTGGLVLGRRAGRLVPRTVSAGRLHDIPIEVLEGVELTKRFPAFWPLPEDTAVYEPHAGYVVPEDAIRALLEAASRSGAELHFEERVLSWSTTPNTVVVHTANDTYSAGHLVIAAGPWAGDLLQTNLPLRVTRQVMAWIQPRFDMTAFLPENFPVFIAEDLHDGPATYGIPAIDGPAGGVKVAIHGSDTVCTPESIDRTVNASDIGRIIEGLRPRFPALDGGEVVRAKTCLYTMTPDEHFIVGAHPQVPSCTIACGFSGHGFKFAPVIGEILTDLATTGATQHPVTLFSPLRF